MSNRELPMMPFYPNEFDASTKGWTWEERGVYHLLLAAQWQIAVLPTSPKALAKVVGCTAKKFTTLWRRLEPKFPEIPTGRQNFRLEQHRLASLAHKESRRKGAEKTNAQRYGQRSLSDRSASRSALASDSRIHGSTDSQTEHPQPPQGGGGISNGSGRRPRAERDASKKAWSDLLPLIDTVRDSTAPRLTWQHVIENGQDRVAVRAAEAVGFRAIADRDRFTTTDLEGRFRDAYERAKAAIA